MTSPTAGIVLARRRLVAAILHPGDRQHRVLRAVLTDDARAGLAHYLAAAGAEIVVPEALAQGDPFASVARAAGLRIWIAPDALVAGIARATAITDPARLAAVMARLPGIPLLRAQLRRAPSGATPTQVPLL